MMGIYFLVTGEENNKIKFLLPPLYYDKDTKVVQNLKVDGNYYFNDLIEEEVYLPKTIDSILPFIIHFPGRVVKNFKIKSPAGNYVIADIDNSHGWYGITVAEASEDYLPITDELNLARKIYNLASKGLKKGEVDFYKSISLIRDYDNNLSSLLGRIRKKHGEEFHMEETMTPKKGDFTKWDFFAYDQNGIPVTGIHRYDSRKGFFRLDMNQEVSVSNFTGKLNDLHTLNCAGLMSFYGVCTKFLEGARLRHITSYLPNANGIGFTFIDRVDYGERGLILVVDVKNKLKGEKKYIGKLFGNERATLDELSRKVATDYTIRTLMNQTDEGSFNPLLEKKLFGAFEEVVNSHAK